MSPETLHNGVWTWYDVMDDLENAGVSGVIVDPLSVRQNFCAGSYRDKPITISWVKDKFMLLSMGEYSQELVDGFSRVLGYKPFCKYVSRKSGLPTVEWDKEDPKSRYEELKKDKSEIEKLEPFS